MSLSTNIWSFHRLLLVLLTVVIVSGCAPHQRPEVVERKVLTQRQQDERIGGQFIRIVQPGDTLYSIAFVTGLDVNKIAAWNGIGDTSKLAAGQRIRLTEPAGFRYPEPTRPRSTSAKPRDIAKSKPATVKPDPSSKRRSQPRSAKSSSSKIKPKIRPSASSKPKNSQSAPAKRVPEPAPKSDKPRKIVSWAWPLRGTIVKRFNLNQGQQGIDIQGQRGQAVKATAAGEVVYAGDSLKGYGNLIIIKHNSDYLSAYAHNQSILVAEGAKITQGQVIAKLGGGFGGRSVAQFQIRKNGNPVDPMLYLR